MKLKLILSSLLVGSVLTLSAQGYKDGIEYYKVKQPERATILLNRNLNEASTNKADSYYYLGLIALEAGNKADAKKYFDLGLAANPQSALNMIGLGALALENNDVKTAKTYFNDAAKINKKDPAAYLEIARAYYFAHPITYAKQVEEYVGKAKNANKQYPDIYLFQGDMLADQEKWGDAAGYYEMAQNFDATNAPAYVKYAQTYYKVVPSVAIDKLNEYVSKYSSSALAQRELAEKLYEDGQWTRAAEVYGNYIKNPNHFKDDEERYVVLLYYGKKYDESFALAQKILAENPNAFLMKRLSFLNKAALEQYPEAAEIATKFFGSTNPNDKYSSNDYTTYGDVLKALKQDSLALIQYEKAYEINPEKTDLLKDLSAAYGNMKNYVKSAEIYQKYIDAGSYSTNDLYVLSGKYQNVLATSEDPAVKAQAAEKALANVDAVLAKVPNDYRIHQRKARILRLTEESDKDGKAIPSYTEMIAVLDQNPENVQKHLDAYKEGYIYLIQNKIWNGDNAGAKEITAKYIAIDPSNTELKDYVDRLK